MINFLAPANKLFPRAGPRDFDAYACLEDIRLFLLVHRIRRP